MTKQSSNQITVDSADQLGNWWSLSSAVQKAVASTVPSKNTWTLNISKDSHGDWVFSLPQFLTFNEALTNGTEKVIDYHFEAITGKKAMVGDKMKMTVSTKEIENFTTTLLYWDKDALWPESNWFIDSVSDGNVWLCPYLQVLFKKVPGKMWVKFEP